MSTQPPGTPDTPAADSTFDPDSGKGAVEDDAPHLNRGDVESQVSYTGQSGHRSNAGEEMPDGSDTDFPEPGESPEHT